MYARSARFYDVVHRDVDYAAEAARLDMVIRAHVPAARTLLDVGCGTGRHLEHLREHYDVAGLDLAPELLEVARRRLPGVPLHKGDLRRFRLDRRFDAITCLFAAIGYARTLDGLAAAAHTLAAHVAPAGVVLVEPWLTPAAAVRFAESFDEPPLARVVVGAAKSGVWEAETHYLVADGRAIEHFSERHELGVFTAGDYERAFADAGLGAELVPVGRGLYVCRPSTPQS